MAGNSSDTGIGIQNLVKGYVLGEERIRILNGLNLEVPAGKITVVLGRSGCGKTTLLRLVGGLEQADSGEVNMQGIKPAIVFQEPRLMPWLTVYENTVFGLDRKEVSDQRQNVEKILSIVGLEKFVNSYPSQLSGGMQARCALARALAVKPSFLLMDEPFAALDYFTRESMQKELMRVQKTLGTGILFVTHSIEEALLLADRIAVIGDGVVKGTMDLFSEKTGRELTEESMLHCRNTVLGLLAVQK